MTTVSQGSPLTLIVYAGEQMTVVADALSSGTVVYLGVPGTEPASPSVVAASATVLIGPDAGTRHYRVNADAGSLTVSVGRVDFLTPHEVDVELSTLTTAQIGAAGASIGIGIASKTTAIAAIAAGTTAKAALNLASGVAPTSPNDGDVWYDGTNLKIRVGASTKTVTIT